MSQLRVYKNNTLVSEFPLTKEKEFIFGRGENCDLSLDPEPGISRQHFSIKYENEKWLLIVQSRYGELYFNNEKIENLTLENQTKFTIPPYEFIFDEENTQASNNFNQKNDSELEEQKIEDEIHSKLEAKLGLDLDANLSPKLETNFSDQEESKEEPQEENSPQEYKEALQKEEYNNNLEKEMIVATNNSQMINQNPSEDKTFLAVSTFSPFLKMLNEDGLPEKIYKLEGNSWVAGRDETCALFIENGKISRKHFEICRVEKDFFIRDLESANGTLLNGSYLPRGEWSAVQSGDMLVASNVVFQFELKDERLEKELAESTRYNKSPIIYQEGNNLSEINPYNNREIGFPSQLGGVNNSPPPNYNNYQQEEPYTPPKKKPNFIRFAIIGLVGFGVLFYFLDSTKVSNKEAGLAVNKSIDPFDALSKEKREYIRQTYLAGQSLFKQGKYELARQEMIRIHSLLPKYEDSRQIESLASVALEGIEQKRKMELEEQRKAEIEAKIQKQVAYCRRIINSRIEMSQMDTCLSPIIEFNPEHPGIVSLKGEVNRLSELRQMQDVEKAEYQEKVRQLASLYQKAQDKIKNGGHIDDIEEAYQKVFNSPLPDPRKLKEQAKRDIAALKQKSSNLDSTLQTKGDRALKDGKVKEAISYYKKSIELKPDNEVVKGKLASVLTDLRKKMQNIYQEGILEESVGEVETAKIKWKKIIEQSAPGEDYYEKAKLKLKKYGAF